MVRGALNGYSFKKFRKRNLLNDKFFGVERGGGLDFDEGQFQKLKKIIFTPEYSGVKKGQDNLNRNGCLCP